MDTIDAGRYEDTNAIFEKPQVKKYEVDYHVAQWFDDTHAQLVPIIERYIKKQQNTVVGYSAWRMEQEGL